MALTGKELNDFLAQQEICHVATVCADGSPHVVPVWFVWVDEVFYWRTGRNTTKAQNLKRDNRIMVSVGGKDTVLFWGKAVEVNRNEIDFDLEKTYWDKYPQHMKTKYFEGDIAIFRLDIQKTMSRHY